MTFTVTNGHCAGSFDAVLLSTDLEPDDAVAIKALAPRLRDVPLLVVVGEGDTDGKPRMVRELLAQYGIAEKATIVQGRRSSTPYPPSALAAYMPSDTGSTARIMENLDAPALASMVQAFLLEHMAPFALLLKPPHEFIGKARDDAMRWTGCRERAGSGAVGCGRV